MDSGAGLPGGANMEGVIRIEEENIRSHVDEVVRETVEQTLNGLLDAEADALCGARRYERLAERLDTRAGHYDRKLQTQAREVTLQVPRLRSLPFETQIIERYRRRQSSVEEALVEMYLADLPSLGCSAHHQPCPQNPFLVRCRASHVRLTQTCLRKKYRRWDLNPRRVLAQPVMFRVVI